jgi:hypothetical protein
LIDWEDGLDERPCFVYVIGPFGGPYKIGYAFKPTSRKASIYSTIAPPPYAVWWQEECRSSHHARIVEKLTHFYIEDTRVVTVRSGLETRHPNMEWFALPLSRAIKAVIRAKRASETGRVPKRDFFGAYFKKIDIPQEIIDGVNGYRYELWQKTMRVIPFDRAVRELIAYGLSD